jgi:hypothetical protein
MADDATPKSKGRGGARPGAGRPVKAHLEVAADTSAIDFLTKCFQSASLPMPLRIRSAAVVVSATVARPGAEKTGKRARALLEAEDLM